jgi:hypothetical protein
MLTTFAAISSVVYELGPTISRLLAWLQRATPVVLSSEMLAESALNQSGPLRCCLEGPDLAMSINYPISNRGGAVRCSMAVLDRLNVEASEGKCSGLGKRPNFLLLPDQQRVEKSLGFQINGRTEGSL